MSSSGSGGIVTGENRIREIECKGEPVRHLSSGKVSKQTDVVIRTLIPLWVYSPTGGKPASFPSQLSCFCLLTARSSKGKNSFEVLLQLFNHHPCTVPPERYKQSCLPPMELLPNGGPLKGPGRFL